MLKDMSWKPKGIDRTERWVHLKLSGRAKHAMELQLPMSDVALS
jgi:hypothetical protein